MFLLRKENDEIKNKKAIRIYDKLTDRKRLANQLQVACECAGSASLGGGYGWVGNWFCRLHILPAIVTDLSTGIRSRFHSSIRRGPVFRRRL